MNSDSADALHVPSGRSCRVVRIAHQDNKLGAWVHFTDANTVMCEWFPLEELLITW